MPERSTREPLLDDDPAIESVTMRDLAGLANAIEQQAVRRYAELADTMDRRGEAATAAALRVMLGQEREHVESIARWAEAMGVSVPPAEGFVLRLPRKLAAAWDETTDSALLTPYRAFALAVDNEERAFAFYSYLAARAADARVAAEAEKLGAEELRHAAVLRQFRRRAWREDRRPMRLPDLTVSSSKALQEVLDEREAAIRSRHLELAARLRALGDDESAALLEQTARAAPAAPAPGRAADVARKRIDAADDHVSRGRESIAEGGEDARALLAAWADAGPADAAAPETPAHLLIEAQKPLEALSETLEAIMRTTEGAIFEQAASAMNDVIARLARISLQAAQRLDDRAPGTSGAARAR